MSWRVTLTAAAKNDIRQILNWIGGRSQSGAETWYRRWSDVVRRLSEEGDTLGVAPEDEDHDETIRQIVFRTRSGLPYRAIFVVRGENLFVLRIRGPGQDFVPSDELLG